MPQMRILVLWTDDSPSTRRICAAVQAHAGALGLTPIFAQCGDQDAVTALAATAGYRILPLDDTAVGLAARLSPRMERPLLSGDPAALADKWGQRRAFAAHGMPSPPFALVETDAEVLGCGERWGYPLVVKPARGAESRGVRRVDGPAAVTTALAEARAAAQATGWERILAEGYLDGPDVAVESVVLDGVTHHVSISQSGWRGHCWQAATPLEPALQPQLDAIGAAVAHANTALGIRWAATSHEVRVTGDGPMLVEANVRLGGGACEEAIRLHAGVDRVQVLLAMLAGSTPEFALQPPRPVVQTAIRATAPGLVRAVEVSPRLLDDPAVQVWVRAAPGLRIDDPAAHFVAWLLVEGRPGEHAGHLLPRASAYAGEVRITTTPL